MPGRSVKADSSTVSYVHRLSSAFFGCVRQTAVEFRKAFDGGAGAGEGEGEGDDGRMVGALLTWMDEEVDRFCLRVEKQLFSPSTPLEIISASVSAVREGALALGADGVDLAFLVDDRFRRNVERTVSWAYYLGRMHPSQPATVCMQSGSAHIARPFFFFFRTFRASSYAPSRCLLAKFLPSELSRELPDY